MSRLLRPGATVEMAHGGGGLATTRLIREIFARHFANPILAQGHDAARIDRVERNISVVEELHGREDLRTQVGELGHGDTVAFVVLREGQRQRSADPDELLAARQALHMSGDGGEGSRGDVRPALQIRGAHRVRTGPREPGEIGRAHV